MTRLSYISYRHTAITHPSFGLLTALHSRGHKQGLHGISTEAWQRRQCRTFSSVSLHLGSGLEERMDCCSSFNSIIVTAARKGWTLFVLLVMLFLHILSPINLWKSDHFSSFSLIRKCNLRK